MMSYLWILLLGSLLAASAKAQEDDAVPTEEVTTLETTEPTAEADAPTDSSEDTAADEETEETSEEISPTEEAESETTEDPEPTADFETTVDPEPTAEPTESTTEAEEVTPAGDVDSAIADILTTIVAIIEEEAAATSEPEAEAETEEPVKPEPEEEDKPAKANATTEAPKGGADPDAEDAEKEATDPDVIPIKPDVAVPDGNADLGFDLKDALDEGAAAVEDPAQPGKSRSLEPGPKAAGATGDVDKPDAEESGSSSLAGILSAVVIAAVGGVAAYITYQKKMLCFKNRQADPEAARKADAAEAQSDPQVLSNLLNSS
ncbi:translation initiation factor IF-2 [Xyrichtys novacula]|uniref:Translation initiation factor IF-2 n=1 Tax=Xyrichtys novacula TaxID=13765 RepID=A0AAV1H4N8_XYRNO|nr:translation initiation factor IF-2 [Xyrichtys novacula]